MSGVEVGVIDAGHLSDEEIVEVAAASQASRLVCSHLYRELDEVELKARAKEKGYEGELVVGWDFMTFEL